MKKRFKFLSAVLALVLALGTISGCGSNSASGSSANSGSSAPGSANNVASNEIKEIKKVNLTIGAVSIAPQTEPINWNETEIWQYILNYVKDNYGYEITPEWILYDKETVNLMLVSGELPDIVYLSGQETANTLVNSDYLVNINDYRDMAPNIFSDTYEQRNEVIMSLTGNSEKLYFLPTSMGVENVDGGANPGRGYTVNWAWYKEIGCPEIKNDDDYVNILTQMVANHPTNSEGEKVFAYGLRGDSFGYWFQRACFTYPAMMNYWTYDGFLFMDGYDDNVLYDGYINTDRSCYWQDMEFCWKLNQKGVFDTDSFTQTNDEFKAKMKTGRYAGCYRPVNDLYNGQKANDPDTLQGFLVVPSTNEMLFGNKLHLAGYFPDNYYAVAKRDAKNKDKEAASVALLDAWHNLDIQRLTYVGFEGKHWNYVDGVPTMTPEFQALRTSGDDSLAVLGIGVNRLQFCQPAEKCSDGYAIDLAQMNLADNLNKLQQDYSDYYKVSVPGLAIKKLVDEGKIIDHTVNYSQTVAIAREEMPSDISRILTKCNELYYNNMSKLITAPTWDDFKKIQKDMIDTVKSYGEQEAWEWCSKNHENARKVIKPIYEEYLAQYKATKKSK